MVKQTVWQHKQHTAARQSGRAYTLVVSSILKAQGLKNLPLNRKLLWDPPIYRGCGLEIPPEYGTFDRWLEKLWFEVLEEVAQAKDQRAANLKERL